LFTNTNVLAPTFLHREQWQVAIMLGAASNSNFIAPQQQLPRIIFAPPSSNRQH
jgi:hypothetical protein